MSSWHYTCLGLLVAGLASLAWEADASEQPQDVAQLYSKLKDIENKSITVDVGTASQLKLNVKYDNNFHHRDELKLERPSVIGAGVFTVPALPLALIYEPPQGKLKKNTAKYVKTRSGGTTVRLSF